MKQPDFELSDPASSLSRLFSTENPYTQRSGFGWHVRDKVNSQTVGSVTKSKDIWSFAISVRRQYHRTPTVWHIVTERRHLEPRLSLEHYKLRLRLLGSQTGTGGAAVLMDPAAVFHQTLGAVLPPQHLFQEGPPMPGPYQWDSLEQDGRDGGHRVAHTLTACCRCRQVGTIEACARRTRIGVYALTAGVSFRERRGATQPFRVACLANDRARRASTTTVPEGGKSTALMSSTFRRGCASWRLSSRSIQTRMATPHKTTRIFSGLAALSASMRQTRSPAISARAPVPR